MKNSKKSALWMWKMDCPADGSVPTVTFTPWEELTLWQKTKLVISIFITVGMMLYGAYVGLKKGMELGVKIGHKVSAICKRYASAIDDFCYACKNLAHRLTLGLTLPRGYLRDAEEEYLHDHQKISDNDDDDADPVSKFAYIDKEFGRDVQDVTG